MLARFHVPFASCVEWTKDDARAPSTRTPPSRSLIVCLPEMAWTPVPCGGGARRSPPRLPQPERGRAPPARLFGAAPVGEMA
jgi:hypothetical protein